MKDIVKDYEKLISLDISIPIYNSEVINFTFKRENLPHLLGLHKLKDIDIIQRFNNSVDNKVTAKTIYKMMKNGDKELESLKSSKYYTDIYENKIKYFSSENILKAIKNQTIIEFDRRSAYANLKVYQ